MNNVSLIGRLTADPELKHTQTGLAYARFNIAVDRQFVKQGEERQADFISIVVWNKTAEFVCKYFNKGRRIALNGRIQTGSYTDRDGNKRYTTDVVADNVEFCDSKSESSGGNNGGYNNYQNNNYQNNNYQNNNYQQNGYQQSGSYQPQPPRQEQPPVPMNNYSNGDAGDYIATPSDEDLPF